MDDTPYLDKKGDLSTHNCEGKDGTNDIDEEQPKPTTKEELRKICADKTPYFEEEDDLFMQNVVPLDWYLGDEEWGAFLDEKGKRSIGIEQLIECLEKEHAFKTPVDTERLHIYHNGIYRRDGEAYLKWFLRTKFGVTIHPKTVSDIIYYIKSGSMVSRDRIDSEANCIPLRNVILNLETLEAEKFDPERIFTYKLPVWYDPDAECPQFMSFLNDICKGQEEEIPFLQEWSGYMLYPAYPNLISLWITGPTHTGKTTLIKVWQNLLGIENVLNEDLITFDRKGFELANLCGKLANFSGEITTNKAISPTTFQLITGQDNISTHIKYRQETLNFTSHAKIVVYGNLLPKIPPEFANADSYWIRIRPLVLKNQHVDGVNREVLDELTTKEEISGVLNWALEGLKRIKNNKWEFTKTREEEENRFIIMLASNPILAFFNKYCERDRDATTPIEEIYDAYIKFCEEYDLEEKGEAQFDKELTEVSGVKAQRRGTRVKRKKEWVGLRLKEKL